ncbi:class I SAM-dependent methyltransferase [Porphyromonas pogonae]|uniref:class I SAM-dependent methyltransferase n=1 Tax=Porphyromonas pogonae TaxID=867595 RepID=UPI002E792A42|nr:class I SAM-dependent methyltransferase [Porphyromonas pogonae]
MKRKYEFNNIISETLLIPLYMRAKESSRGEGAILHDPLAEKLVSSLDYDFSRFDGAKMSELGCVVRGRYFDDAVSRFISLRKNPVVVNVGCGLDTRFQRLNEIEKAIFYEMDLPEVIDLRRELIPEPSRDHYLSASLLKTDWMDELKQKHPQADFIFVVEGVLMYFFEDDVKSFLNELVHRFTGGELWFDVCGPNLIRSKYIKPDSLKNHDAQIRSGFADGHVGEEWAPGLKLIEQALYQKKYTRRWAFMPRMMGYFPGICKKFSSMLGYEIHKPNEN